jgi:hypothetical protein
MAQSVNVAAIRGEARLSCVKGEELLNAALPDSSPTPDEECPVFVSPFLEVPPKKRQEVSEDRPFAR